MPPAVPAPAPAAAPDHRLLTAVACLATRHGGTFSAETVRAALGRPVPDPAGASLEEVYAIRGDLDARTASLLSELLSTA
ncbi:hypothetical protein NMG29_36725 [Streptomyces cocklensis]|jgi:hypothetical protein|uniref:Uncharacterized protein n=1 Tax=Actinacidiphila cocklensis TaxID=887465 RepID=A0A9W4GND7_9ACTN|nr:hypothetical protein [Actinacidiphila cocklensis]MDD1063646.1 hypothetical protein [Actinacidiphila cocklensis]WSX72845.1 hypothetical protein OH826_02660 [Streptomyces sp. NBC_00899]WSX81087.1 hypothetical protein OH826_48850 [Streptomyces sp. NBC_00899]CAG6391152.1 hypothetical protein SCOCK_100219 [Actinacidiphila cocklensis]